MINSEFFLKRPRHLYVLALIAMFTGVASAQIKVDAPADNPSLNLVVNSPFYLQAESSSCQAEPTKTMAYSIDDNTQDNMFPGQSIQTVVTGMTNGPHTLHVKAWNGVGNEVCVENIALTVGGGLNVSAPAQETSPWTTVTSPFVLEEGATTCGGGTTSKMTYSLDSGKDTTVNGTFLNTTVSAAAGAHILRAKTWGNSGTYCETDIRLNVASSSGLVPPTGASSYQHMENDGTYTGNYAPCGGATGPDTNLWQTQPDCGTVGTKSGSTSLVLAPVYGSQTKSREFTMTFDTSGGGVRWFDKAIPDTPSATHFQYDTYVYLVDNSKVMNIEMDINHSIGKTGQLYILAAQCNLAKGKWQVTVEGTGWVNTNATCSASQVTSGVWHHFQIQTHHDANGGSNIYYDAIALDGNVTPITTCTNASTGASIACQSTSTTPGWSGLIGPNFQLDGNGSGGQTATAYVDNFTVYYWQ